MEKTGEPKENFVSLLSRWMSSISLKSDEIETLKKSEKANVDELLNKLLQSESSEQINFSQCINGPYEKSRINVQSVQETIEKDIDQIDKLKEVFSILNKNKVNAYDKICEKLDDAIKFFDVEQKTKFTDSEDFNKMEDDEKIEYCDNLLNIIDNEIDKINIKEVDFSESIIRLQNKLNRLVEFNKGIDNFPTMIENIKNMLHYMYYVLNPK